MRPLILLGVSMLAAAGASAQYAEFPRAGADWSAYRLDTEVFGWSRDYKEVAALALDVRRGRDGEHRGEAYLLGFDIDKVTPKRNVHVLVITQGANPRDPLPLEEAKDRLWGIDHVYQKLWPRRPKYKQPRGAMDIEPIWLKVEVEPTLCQPAVGFVLRHRGEVRYQPHQLLKLKAPCVNLRHGHTRTYWAKGDLGVSMIRFDYSPNEREQSIRFPISAGWDMAQSVRLVVSADTSAAMMKTLSAYGRPTVRAGEAPAGVAFAPELSLLARQIAAALDLPISGQPPPKGVGISVVPTATMR